jgi:hypothetical protein
MTLTETQRLRMPEQLWHTGNQPVTLDQLRAGEIDFPAVVVGELELNGYVIERNMDDAIAYLRATGHEITAMTSNPSRHCTTTTSRCSATTPSRCPAKSRQDKRRQLRGLGYRA